MLDHGRIHVDPDAAKAPSRQLDRHSAGSTACVEDECSGRHEFFAEARLAVHVGTRGRERGEPLRVALRAAFTDRVTPSCHGINLVRARSWSAQRAEGGVDGHEERRIVPGVRREGVNFELS